MKIWILAALSLAAAPAWALPAAPQGASDEEIHRMLAIRVDEQRQATGAVVGVIDRYGRRVVSYGTMGLRDQRRVDGDTVFDIGSITKVFTALLLADEVQRGDLSLADPAAKYLPSTVRLPQRNGRQITLADLATHTAGLPLRPPNLASKDPANPYAGYTVGRMYRGLSTLRLNEDIGSRYQYSNLGYGLLGQILALRAGQGYAALVQSRITRPLGMDDTGIELSAGMKRRLALGYDGQLHAARHWDEGALAGMGGLRSTANDLLRLLGAFLGYHKSALQPAMQSMLETRRPGGMQPATQIALAWNIYQAHGREVAWKNGSVGGFRSFVGYDLQAGVGVVALANAQTATGLDDIGLHLLDPDFPVNLQKPRHHREIALSPDILDRYVGRYRFGSDGSVWSISRKGNHLFGEAPGQGEFEMFAETEHDFFLKVVDAQASFERSAEGASQSLIWHQGGQEDRAERIE